MALLAEINRDTKKRSQPFTAADFMPKFGDPEEPVEESEVMPWERQLKVIEMWNAAVGGGDVRKAE